ncbi:hypothetical protein NST81_02990 [Bacillus sp. FSL W8-0223]|uniref:hypothetical protein n=1 Tax=Bacillus sp. FSL W8-0223 TaxID=2954595 RepID=UPI0030F64747
MKIAIGNFEKISDDKWHPLHVQYDYENYPLPNYDDIVFVDRVDPEQIEGKYAVMYYNPQTNSVFYEYIDKPLTPEKQIQQLLDANAELTYQLMMKGVL